MIDAITGVKINVNKVDYLSSFLTSEEKLQVDRLSTQFEVQIRQKDKSENCKFIVFWVEQKGYTFSVWYLEETRQEAGRAWQTWNTFLIYPKYPRRTIGFSVTISRWDLKAPAKTKRTYMIPTVICFLQSALMHLLVNSLTMSSFWLDFQNAGYKTGQNGMGRQSTASHQHTPGHILQFGAVM